MEYEPEQTVSVAEEPLEVKEEKTWKENLISWLFGKPLTPEQIEDIKKQTEAYLNDPFVGPIGH